MIIPENIYTQKQIHLWYQKALEARHQAERIDLINQSRALAEAQRGERKYEDPSPFAWGSRFLDDLLMKATEPNCWVLLASERFDEKTGDRDDELPTQEFSFLLMNPARYCFREPEDQYFKGGDFIRDKPWPKVDRSTNLILNGAMINHGTDDKPEWSSHT